MTEQPKIVEVAFMASNDRYGNIEVRALMDDGQDRVKLFAFFDDEIGFTPRELVGLTVEESRDLKQSRDTAYLRSP